MALDRTQIRYHPDQLCVCAETEFTTQSFVRGPMIQGEQFFAADQAVSDDNDSARREEFRSENLITDRFGIDQHAMRDLMSQPISPDVRPALREPQVTLRSDHSRPRQSRSDRAEKARVKIVRVQNVNPLADEQRPQPSELTQGIGVIKTGQRKFRHGRKESGNFFVKRARAFKRGQAHIELLTIQPLEQFDCLPLSPAALEVVDEMQHAQTLTGRAIPWRLLLLRDDFSQCSAHDNLQQRKQESQKDKTGKKSLRVFAVFALFAFIAFPVSPSQLLLQKQ
jgi:hypothetical protein